jgi:hypothetical protein
MQVTLVSSARKKAGIKYPQCKQPICFFTRETENICVTVYAEKAEMEKSLEARKFNCAQRKFFQ